MFDLLCAPRSRQNKSVQLIKILDNGTQQHARFSAHFVAMAEQARVDGVKKSFGRMGESHFMGIKSVEHDVRVGHPKLPIEGEIDLLVEMHTGYVYVIDVKTINNKGWSSTLSVKPQHRLQMNTYLGLSGASAGDFIYENKDNQKWIPKMRVDFDGGVFKASEDYCVDTLNALRKGDFPSFDEGVCKNANTFCSYVEVCNRERAGENVGKFDNRPVQIRRKHERV
jgi:hypothetical protein